MKQIPALNPIKKLVPGLTFVTLLSILAFWISSLPFLQKAAISPLIIGILLGAIPANLFENRIPHQFSEGLRFSTSRILRTGIALYGFKITLQELSRVGLPGLLVSIVMVSSTFLLGTLVAIRFFKMDRDTALLTAAGSSICGAAAVLAMESYLKADSYKSAVAVSTVVLFGTLAMFLYPAAYSAGLIPMTENEMGIYIGGTIHEVAHVVGASNAIGHGASDNAIIVKMTRVLLLLPVLLLTGWFINKNKKETVSSKMSTPWFAVAFMAVVLFNSLVPLEKELLDSIHKLDTFLLTMAMTALGIGTTWKRVKKAGSAPLFVSMIMFVWLVFGGFFVTLQSMDFCFANCPVTR